MVEVRLHGELAREFGKVWHLAVETPREACQAIEANTLRFFKKIRELDRRGMVFRVRTKDHDYDSDDVGTFRGKLERIDLIPIVGGSSAGLRFVIGAALVVVGLMNPGIPGANFMVQAGTTLMIGSVVEWLTPVPKKEDVTKNAKSWTLSGPVETLEQGYPVPIIFGEVLTDGYPISAGMSASQLNTSGSLDPMVTIGGELEVYLPVVLSTGTALFRLHAGPFNIDEPYTYAWSVASFVNSTGVVVKNANKATVDIEVSFSTSNIITITGNVTLLVSGRKSGTTGADTPVPVFATVTKQIKLTVDLIYAQGN